MSSPHQTLGSAAARDHGAMWATKPIPWVTGVCVAHGRNIEDTYGRCQGGVGKREALQVSHQAGGDDAARGDRLGRWGGDCGGRKGLRKLQSATVLWGQSYGDTTWGQCQWHRHMETATWRQQQRDTNHMRTASVVYPHEDNSRGTLRGDSFSGVVP